MAEQVLKYRRNIFKRGIKRTAGEQVIFTIAFILIGLFTLFMLYHFYFLIQLATKADQNEFINDLATNSIASWSENFSLGNFGRAFELFVVEGQSFFMLIFNSIWYSIGSELIILFVQSLLCYTLCKYQFPGRTFIYNLILVRMLIPIYGSLPAAVRLYKALGLMNNPLILVTAVDCLSSSALIMFAFYKAISWEYAEAAFIDGASHFQVYFKVMFPMALPSISVLFVTGFIGRWNEYMAICIYLPKLPTLSYALYIYQELLKYEGDYPVYFSGIIIAASPCIVLFLIFQNSIMQTVHFGGIKG